MSKRDRLRDRGQYVRELVNQGAGGMSTGLRIGVVTRAGPRQYEVCWESGFRRRYPQGYGHALEDWQDWPEPDRQKVKDEIFRHCGI